MKALTQTKTKKKAPRLTGTQIQAALRKNRQHSAVRTRQRYDVLAMLKRVEGSRSGTRGQGANDSMERHG